LPLTVIAATAVGGNVYSKENIEDRLRALIQVGSFSVFRMNNDWTEMLSLEGRDLVGEAGTPGAHWLERLIPEQEREAFEQKTRASIALGAPFELDHQLTSADSDVSWVRTRATPIHGPDGLVSEWLGTMTDITEIKEQEAHQRFLLAWSDRVNPLSTPQCVMEASAEMLGAFLGAGRVRYIEMEDASMIYARSAEWVNEGLGVKAIEDRFTLSQFSPELVSKVRSGTALVTPDVRDDPQVRPQAQLFEANQVRAGILVPLIKDGQLSGALSVHMPTPRNWRPLEVRAVEEIAERTWSAVQRSKAEARLHGANTSLQLAFEIADLVPWQLVLPERKLIISRDLSDPLRTPARPLSYGHFLAFVHPEDRGRLALAVETSIADQESFDIEYRIIVRGTRRWYRSRGRHEGAGDRARLIGVSQDITAQKAAEEAQRLDAERLRLIFDSARDYAIIALDPDGRITRWNAGAERILGFSEAEALGASEEILFTPEDLAAGVPSLEKARALSGERVENERWHLRKDGSRFWASGEMAPLVSGDEKGFLKIFRDLTQKRQAEESLRLLVDELNHRVKNTLATVQSICRQTLRNAAVPDETMRKISGRLQALASSHDLLTREHWAGASMTEVIETVLKPFVGASQSERVRLEGPQLTLSPKAAVTLSIGLHELCTNAASFGSLSIADGALSVVWRVEEAHVELEWSETGIEDAARNRRGFGSRVIEEALAHELRADVALTFAKSGLNCVMRIPREGNIR
jgi:PAS domain S-box-containing protein